MEGALKEHLEESVARRVPKTVSVRCMVIKGHPAEQIVDTAEQEHVDLIMIATRGLTGWRRRITGSVAEKVVRLSASPVLVLPGTAAKE
jgi:nucleotide-binding universal stress UspA family protein